ncbi:hypothetical protein JMG10_10520 [Nostoc ellipsosporum NOK]|nr:hypothetical protein [Nostoc ellipsosporum NOK]
MAAGACHICKRPLDVQDDPLSADCGGDCWGCVGFIEYEMAALRDFEDRLSTLQIEHEIREGFREADGQTKRPNA